MLFLLQPMKVEVLHRQPHSTPCLSAEGGELGTTVRDDATGQSSPLSRRGSRSSIEMLSLVAQELLLTEQTYVSELQSVLNHYVAPFDTANPQTPLLPDSLRRRKDELFGNLPDICRFHSETFSADLRRAGADVDAVAKCFLTRRDCFYRLYNEYCRNKAKSDALRLQLTETCPYFLVS